MKPEVFVVESRSPEETQHLGEHLARGCYAGLSLLLRGDLGSGKTEMARGFLAHLGYGRVRSPSFSLVHEYPTTPLVVHVDLYRLPEQQDLEDLGLEEYLLRGAVLLWSGLRNGRALRRKISGRWSLRFARPFSRANFLSKQPVIARSP